MKRISQHVVLMCFVNCSLLSSLHFSTLNLFIEHSNKSFSIEYTDNTMEIISLYRISEIKTYNLKILFRYFPR
jgi:hypothetical protein